MRSGRMFLGKKIPQLVDEPSSSRSKSSKSGEANATFQAWSLTPDQHQPLRVVMWSHILAIVAPVWMGSFTAPMYDALAKPRTEELKRIPDTSDMIEHRRSDFDVVCLFGYDCQKKLEGLPTGCPTFSSHWLSDRTLTLLHRRCSWGYTGLTDWSAGSISFSMTWWSRELVWDDVNPYFRGVKRYSSVFRLLYQSPNLNRSWMRWMWSSIGKNKRSLSRRSSKDMM